jgi:hypothetical protein
MFNDTESRLPVDGFFFFFSNATINLNREYKLVVKPKLVMFCVPTI